VGRRDGMEIWTTGLEEDGGGKLRTFAESVKVEAVS
jgi:hypothetical protein